MLFEKLMYSVKYMVRILLTKFSGMVKDEIDRRQIVGVAIKLAMTYVEPSKTNWCKSLSDPLSGSARQPL
jgi:hypothetical protein